MKAKLLIPLSIVLFSIVPVLALAAGETLAVAQSSEPVTPILRGTRFPLQEFASNSRMTATGQQAQNVELVSQLGGRAIAIATRGSYAYVGDGLRLVILNVSNPAIRRSSVRQVSCRAS